MAFKITLLPGDGIGPEVMAASIKVLNYVAEKFNTSFEYTEELIGGICYDKYGTPLTDKTLQACYDSDAVLLGAVGGYKWEELDHHLKPEAALLNLRKSLGLFTNIRPAKVYSSFANSSSLKEKILIGTDFVVFRELTGGIYFGEPRGYDDEKGWNTMVYQKDEIERIARQAFNVAAKRNVDNAAIQIVRDPRQFDVIVTSNLFGDIISDVAGMITGSIGMLPSASIGTKYALYEPVHGSAPDIAGQNKANPIAMIASIGMMLDLSFGLTKAAEVIEAAIERTLEQGYRTVDINSDDGNLVSTTQMADMIIENFEIIYNELALGVFTL